MIAAFLYLFYKLCGLVDDGVSLFRSELVVIQRVAQALAELDDIPDSRFPQLKISLL